MSYMITCYTNEELYASQSPVSTGRFTHQWISSYQPQIMKKEQNKLKKYYSIVNIDLTYPHHFEISQVFFGKHFI